MNDVPHHCTRPSEKKVSAVSEKRLLPDTIVCRRYGVCSMTLWRWDHDPNLKFPKPLRISGLKYRDQNELDAFDAAQVNNGASSKYLKADDIVEGETVTIREVHKDVVGRNENE